MEINNENHRKLKSNVPFEELPKWFRDSKTENAEVIFNTFLTWKNGLWISGIWKGGLWVCGIWKNGIWKSGIWKSGTWKSGTWESGIWESGIWEDGYKSIGFCKWRVFCNTKTEEIEIGCKTKTVKQWDKWFNSDDTYKTSRDSLEFEQIKKSFELAKKAIELKL